MAVCMKQVNSVIIKIEACPEEQRTWLLTTNDMARGACNGLNFPEQGIVVPNIGCAGDRPVWLLVPSTICPKPAVDRWCGPNAMLGS